MEELNNKNPLVYIVMPCYNGEKYLLEQLMSIYYQNYTNRYLIFVNDGSTDNSENILRDWISHYNLHDKVMVINKENGGVNSAVQRGLEEIKNMCDIHNTDNLIAYCDADDIRTRDKLKISVEYMLQHPEIGLMYHDLSVMNENGIISKKNLLKNKYRNDSFFNFSTLGNYLTSTEMVFRLELIEYILPMPIGFAMTQDKWTSLVLLLNDVKFHYINTPLAIYRVGHMSIMYLAKKTPIEEMNKARYRYILELKNRFPDKDISYALKYNRDRWVERPKKGYSNHLSYIIMLFKYPKVFFNGLRATIINYLR